MNAIDCALTYEELFAMFESRGIDLESLEEAPLDEASPFGRNFARSGGCGPGGGGGPEGEGAG